jgi:WD40 repeat protein
VAFSSDGKTMASGSYDGSARLWDVSDPVHPVSRYRIATDRPAAIRSIALSPDGRLLAAGGEDHAVELWDISGAPALVNTLTDHTNTVTSVALSADGKSLASASWDRTVSVWNISDPRDAKVTATLSGPTDNVTAVAFDPRGGSVAAGVANAPNLLWQTDPDAVAGEVCAVRGTPVSEAEWHTYVSEDSPTDPC